MQLQFFLKDLRAYVMGVLIPRSKDICKHITYEKKAAQETTIFARFVDPTL